MKASCILRTRGVRSVPGWRWLAANWLAVNVGGVRAFEYGGRPARSAIWKSPAVGRIAARGINLAGDDQADRKAHGGPDKALYAYALEDARWGNKRSAGHLPTVSSAKTSRLKGLT